MVEGEIIKPVDILDGIKGCILGSFIGDSAGAVLEGKYNITEEQVNMALELKSVITGWGEELGPGQGTDDTEMGMALAWGLIQGEGELDIRQILKYYAHYFHNDPVGGGSTTRDALSQADPNNPNPDHVRNAAREASLLKSSNGSLMRITPLCCWMRNLENPYENIPKAVKEEHALTHPSINCYECGVAYALAVYHLLNNFGDRKGAYNYARDWVLEYASTETKIIFDKLEAGEELDWTGRKMSYVYIALTHSMKYLKSDLTYYQAIKSVLLQGGDTDTNAAIVGGIIGASVGAANLPQEMVQKILSFDPENGKGVKRPDFLLPSKHALILIDKIKEIAPEKLIVKQGMGI